MWNALSLLSCLPVRRPRFSTVKQYTKHTGIIDADFGADGKVWVIPYTLGKVVQI